MDFPKSKKRKEDSFKFLFKIDMNTLFFLESLDLFKIDSFW